MIERLDFRIQVFHRAIRDLIQVCRRIDSNRGTDGNTGGTRQTLYRSGTAGFMLVEQLFHFATGFGMRHGTCQLRGDRDQKIFLFFIEALRFGLLHDKDTQHLAVMDDRYPQETVVLLLGGAGKKMITRMLRCIIDIDGLGTTGDLADNALIKSQAYPADRRGSQTPRRHQYMLFDDFVRQINGTDIGMHRLAHLLDNDIQCLIEITGSIHLLDDTA